VCWGYTVLGVHFVGRTLCQEVVHHVGSILCLLKLLYLLKYMKSFILAVVTNLKISAHYGQEVERDTTKHLTVNTQFSKQT